MRRAASSTVRVTLVGPTHPIRGGISHYTTLLARALNVRHALRLWSFRRQYPGWLYPGREQRDDVSAATLRVKAEPRLDGVNPLNWLAAARSLRADPPDLLVLQWTVSYWAPLLWLLARAVAGRSRVVVICHNASPHERGARPGTTVARALQRRVLGRADRLICHAATDEEELRRLLPRAEIRRVMHPSYVALAEVAAPPSPPIRPGDPALLFFGFVRPYKGVDVLLAAMPRVLEALPGAHLTIAGEWWAAAGDPAARLDPTIDSAVTILDRYVSNEEMAALFAAADVAVLPYRSATQSGVVQLAFGFGVPVITTTVGGLPEAVEHEVSGLLVPPDDPAALAAAIVRYHREGWRARLTPGVAAARDRFSWEAVVEAIEGAAGSG